MFPLLIVLAANFGDAGTVVPGGQVRLSHSTYEHPDDRARTSMSAFIGPEIDYFFVDDLSVGIGLGLSAQAFEGVALTSLDVRLGAGYHLALSEDVGIYPRVSLTVTFDRLSFDALGTEQVQTGERLRLEVYAPLLYQAGHFFIGMGPHFSKWLMSRSRVDDGPTDSHGTSSAIALATTFGGWF